MCCLSVLSQKVVIPWSGSQDSLQGTTNSALVFHMFITFHNSFSGRVAGRVVRARRVWTKTSPSWRPRRPNGRASLKRWSAWALECRGTRELPGGFPILIHEIILHERVPWPSLVPKGLVLVDTSECWMMASQSFWENGLLRGYSGILLKYLPVIKHGNVKSQFLMWQNIWKYHQWNISIHFHCVKTMVGVELQRTVGNSGCLASSSLAQKLKPTVTPAPNHGRSTSYRGRGHQASEEGFARHAQGSLSTSALFPAGSLKLKPSLVDSESHRSSQVQFLRMEGHVETLPNVGDPVVFQLRGLSTLRWRCVAVSCKLTLYNPTQCLHSRGGIISTLFANNGSNL